MLALVASVLLAQAANPYFVEAKKLAAALQFAEALEQLKVARRVPGQTDAQKVEVLELSARCEIAEGHRAAGQAAFEELLVLSPSFAPDRSLSPKILEAFDAAKERVFPKGYFKLELLPSPPGRARVRVVDPWSRAARFEASKRFDGEGEWALDALERAGDLVTVTLAAQQGHTLEWYVTAIDEQGVAVGQLGTAEAPQREAAPVLAVELTETPPPSRFARWPGWASIALGVGFGIAGAVFQQNSVNEARSLADRTKSPGDWADTARATQAMSMRDAIIATSFFIAGGVLGVIGVVVFAW